ncbi:transposase [Streptomyces sp. enrichment culture]|uniref:transposase n=1 Tax=Streptomyces sp. enrichment culture TaxID=1795815 RepID=UPI003F56D2EC
MRTGCVWRLLPHDLPTWQTVHHYRRRWEDGVWEEIPAAVGAGVCAGTVAGRAAQAGGADGGPSR